MVSDCWRRSWCDNKNVAFRYNRSQIYTFDSGLLCTKKVYKNDILSLETDCNTETSSTSQEFLSEEYYIYPNSFTKETSIKSLSTEKDLNLQILGLAGKTLINKNISISQNELRVDLSTLPQEMEKGLLLKN